MALNGRVLLLNQTYEPLGTVSVARAIIMTFKNTVFVEEWDGDRVLRSAHDEFPNCGVAQLAQERSSCKRDDTSSTLVAAAKILLISDCQFPIGF